MCTWRSGWAATGMHRAAQATHAHGSRHWRLGWHAPSSALKTLPPAVRCRPLACVACRTAVRIAGPSATWRSADGLGTKEALRGRLVVSALRHPARRCSFVVSPGSCVPRVAGRKARGREMYVEREEDESGAWRLRCNSCLSLFASVGIQRDGGGCRRSSANPLEAGIRPVSDAHGPCDIRGNHRVMCRRSRALLLSVSTSGPVSDPLLDATTRCWRYVSNSVP
ncbi:hypothetical protein B0H10DRAFT_3666 [Mycena sp. CBHHK59/15]|nr:hypothetical protein B0H10DRAFT_3666 [Mycena sp. CBHHK59/15]